MTDGALLLLLMAAIFGVFVWAVRRGRSVSARDRAALFALAAIGDASAASDLGYLPAASGEAN